MSEMRQNPQSTWENVEVIDNLPKSRFGNLYLHVTDIAAVLIFLTDLSQINEVSNPINIFSEPLSPAHRFYPWGEVFDMLFFNNFTSMEDFRRVCFQDPVSEFGVSMNFPNNTQLTQFLETMTKSFTIEDTTFPGFYRILRFVPQFHTHVKMRRKSSSPHISILMLHDEITNAINLFKVSLVQNSIDDQKTEIQEDDSRLLSLEGVKELLLSESVQQEHWLRAMLTLLALPQFESFDEYVDKYVTIRNGWSQLTPSQLSRNSWRHQNIVNTTHLIIQLPISLNVCQYRDVFVRTFIFRVFMALGEVDPLIFKFTQLVLSIIMPIVLILFPAPQKDGTVKIRGDYIVNPDKAEAIGFWMLEKILYRFECIRLFTSSADSSAFMDQIHQMTEFTCPPLHSLIVRNDSQSHHLQKHILTLFSSLLTIEDVIYLWISALASSNAFDFMNAFITVALAFQHHELFTAGFDCSQVMLRSIKAHKISPLLNKTQLLMDHIVTNRQSPPPS